MRKQNVIKARFWIALLAAGLIIGFLALPVNEALAQDDPLLYYCMDDVSTNCTAQDFGPMTAVVTEVMPGGCSDHDNDPTTPDAVQIDFTLTFISASSTRYDIGAIIALDGADVLRLDYMGDDCTRTYLPPPLTTLDDQTAWPYLGQFWDAEDNTDTCGDLGDHDSATVYMNDVWVACVDTDNDGQIDVSICELYDNNGKPDCFSLVDATPPGTAAKCQCERVNVKVSPTAITLESLKAGSALPNGYIIALAAALVAASLFSVWLTFRLKKRYAQK